jgi:L-asparaginase II
VLFELGNSGDEKTFFRSSAKIWQAAPMMEKAREMFKFTDAEVLFGYFDCLYYYYYFVCLVV